MSFNVNFFGKIPFNTDLLPEQKKLIGSGTERPIGLTFEQISLLYWTVKSFSVNIVGASIADPLTTFLAAGGSTSLVGSVAGLSAVARDITECASVSMMGNTKVKSVNSVRIRKQPSYIKDGITQKSVELDDSVPNRFVQYFSPISEATICSAGPIHRMAFSANKSNGYILIDFSDIFYGYSVRMPKTGLYWPRIIIMGASNCFIFGSLSNFGGNVNISGGVNFCNMGIIDLFGNTNVQFPIINYVDGSINIGKRCCDRFFWDGKDAERNSESNCKDDCSSVEMSDLSFGKDEVSKIIKNGNIPKKISSSDFNFAGGSGTSGSW